MSQRQLLSVVIITKNEAEMLPDTLACVNWADEIIILDSGSTDTTVEIARKYGAQVHQTVDWVGFGKQRQRAQKFAKGNMILMIDADERVTPKLRQVIEQILKEPNSNRVYSIRRKNIFLGRFIRHSGWYPDRVIRLYPCRFKFNDKIIHESLDTQGAPIEMLCADLCHFTCRNLIKFQYKQLHYAKDWAQENFNRGKKCNIFSVFSHSIAAFIKAILLRAGFLDGKEGFILAVINAQYTFNKYSALWELCSTTSLQGYV